MITREGLDFVALKTVSCILKTQNMLQDELGILSTKAVTLSRQSKEARITYGGQYHTVYYYRCSVVRSFQPGRTEICGVFLFWEMWKETW